MMSIKLARVLNHLQAYPTDAALNAARVVNRFASFVCFLLSCGVAYLLTEHLRSAGGSTEIYLALTFVGMVGPVATVALASRANLVRIIPEEDVPYALLYAEDSAEARSLRDAIVSKGRSLSVFDFNEMRSCSADALVGRLRKIQSAGFSANNARLHTVSGPSGSAGLDTPELAI